MRIVVTRVGRGVQNVGRPTPLGNPFYMANEAMRDEVCDKYVHWFNEQVKANNLLVVDQLEDLMNIGRRDGVLKLGCYCAPKRCHADTIAKFLTSLL